MEEKKEKEKKKTTVRGRKEISTFELVLRT
jgi:hypothetical protein